MECPTCGGEYKTERGMKIHHTKIHGEPIDPPEFECPTCGKMLDTHTGMKTHHYHAHGESIAGEPVECSFCGETIRRRKNVAEKQEDFFCDDDCMGRYHTENIGGENNPNYRGGPIPFNCSWCGESRTRKPSEYNAYEENFCDSSCYGKWRSANLVGENHPNWGGRVVVTCDACGASLRRLPNAMNNERNYCSRVCQNGHEAIGVVDVECNICGTVFQKNNWGINGDTTLCSPECVSEYLSSIRQGSDNPAWTGGTVTYYGPNWDDQRRKALKRDGFECQLCGIDQKENLVRYETQLHVHHIVRFKSFDGDFAAANVLDNLVTACNVCHRKLEQQGEQEQRTLLAAND